MQQPYNSEKETLSHIFISKAPKMEPKKNSSYFSSSQAKVIIFYTYPGLTIPHLKSISYLVKVKK